MQIRPKILFFSLGLTHLLTGCTPSPQKDHTILPTDLHLQAGDVVFRQGSGLDSRTVLAADREGCYSHIGIVVDSAGHPMIVHAVPDEHDFPGDYDRIKMDLPETFFLYSRALIGEVMRPHQQERAQKAACTALRLYQKRLPFDHEYDDTDSSKMYCTELILYAFHSAGICLECRPKRNIHFPIRFYGYFPSDLHASPALTSICIF